MMQMWKASLPGRFLYYLLEIWQYSFIHRTGQAFRRAWQNHWLCRFLTRVMDSGATYSDASLLARMVSRFNRWLQSLSWLRESVHGSVVMRIYRAVWSALCESKLIGWAFRGGMSRLILLVLALYVPIDYVLRDVLPIPILGSVWDELLLMFAAAWAIWMRMDAKVECKARLTPAHTPVILFFLVGAACMIFTASYPNIAISGYRATVQYILWFFIVVSMMRDEKDFFTVYLAMVAVGVVIALHGIYQYIVAVPIPSSWMSSSEQSVRTRVFSIFGSPNIMGDFMVMMAPLAAGLFFYLKDWRLKLLAAAATGLMCFACLFTMSRGAWIGLVVAVLLFVAIVDRRLLVMALVACVCALFVPFVWSRVSYLFSDEYRYLTTNGGRESRWALGISYMYRTNPVFGMGLGMWGGAVAVQHQILHWVWYSYVDHYYLRIFIEMGWVGIIFFGLMMVGLLVAAARGCFRIRKNKREVALTAGIFASLAGVLAHCFFENIFEEPYMMAVFWILAGSLMWFTFIRNRKCEE